MTSNTLDTAEKAIVTHWLDQWSATTRTSLEGEAFEPVKGVAFARLTIEEETSVPETQGAAPTRRFLRGGRVLVQVFFPAGNGTKDVSAAAEIGRSILEGKTIGGCRFFAATVRKLPEDGEWVGRILDAPFDYQQIK